MAIRNYENRDKVPVFLHVLDICAYFYSQIAFKIAVLNHYLELKGDMSVIQCNEQILLLIASSVKSITATLDETAKSHELDLEKYLNTDERILSISEDIYWSLICDDFPDFINEDDCEGIDCSELHDLYFFSLLNIVRSLFQMFCSGEIDLNNFYDQENDHDGFWIPQPCNEEHVELLFAILQLNNHLCAHQEKMYDLHQKLKHDKYDYI